MEGLGSDLDSLLRYPSGPRPLVLDILKGKGSLIEVVRCSENGFREQRILGDGAALLPERSGSRERE